MIGVALGALTCLYTAMLCGHIVNPPWYRTTPTEESTNA